MSEQLLQEELEENWLAFQGLLEFQICDPLMEFFRPDDLPQFAKDNLKRLFEHFTKPDLEADTETGDEEQVLSNLSISSRKRKRHDSVGTAQRSKSQEARQWKKGGPGRPSNTPISTNESWGAARKLQKLQLDHTLRAQLRNNPEGDPKKFLYDQISSTEDGHQGHRGLKRDELLVESFFVCTQLLASEAGVLNYVRYLCRIVAIGDICYGIFDDTRAIKTNGKLAPLEKIISKRYERMTDQERKQMGLNEKDAPIHYLCEEFKKVVKRGMRLAKFCDDFGTGSIFWLQSTFKIYFLDGRWTLKGPDYTEAMQKFQDLALAKQCEDSGANAVCDSVRSYLRDCYNEDEQHASGTEIETS